MEALALASITNMRRTSLIASAVSFGILFSQPAWLSSFLVTSGRIVASFFDGESLESAVWLFVRAMVVLLDFRRTAALSRTTRRGSGDGAMLWVA